MNILEIKQAIVDKAVERLEEKYTDLMDEANVGQQDKDDVAETETGEAGHESESVQLATIMREEAEQVRKDIQAMKNYKFEKPHEQVEMLALVKTNKGNFFISKAIKPVEINKEKYFFLALDAPIYTAMEGKKQGDSFTFNNMKYTINELA
ncbi:MAG: hypothetical protein CL843_05735 [Crocinitomicaceae bacterium]|nr:hypothetical protein [Crocinitomicaceae bacterium]|tara:strand:- start:6424 stop:6876 length:453 start_codon:yes stop_codon:yes gene_type:complete